MPKSKTRRNIKRNTAKSAKSCHSQPARYREMTADPRTWVEDNRQTVPYGTKAAPGHHIVYQAPSTKGMKAHQVRIETMPSGDVWVFPSEPKPHIKHPVAGEPESFDSSANAIEIALGSKRALIESLDESTRELMLVSAPDQSGRDGVLTELYRHGIFNYRNTDDEVMKQWLDQMYLGTWEDTSWAAAAFLKDLEGAVSDERRIEAYERLKEMLVVIEIPIGNGRTVVALDQPCEFGDRFLVVQWMLHRNIPVVLGL